MHVENFKPVIKAAYLLQLRSGSFSGEELVKSVGDAKLHDVLNLGFLAEQKSGGERRYSITEKGRAQIKVVLAGGVYDVLHLGHLSALTEAKALGDVLIAVVATDITVETLKGRKPIFPQEDRRALVEGLKPVDKAILGYEDVGFGFEQVLMEVRPDIVAFGYDQDKLERAVSEIIEGRNLRVQVVRLSRFEHEKYLSSTSIKERLSEALR